MQLDLTENDKILYKNLIQEAVNKIKSMNYGTDKMSAQHFKLVLNLL